MAEPVSAVKPGTRHMTSTSGHFLWLGVKEKCWQMHLCAERSNYVQQAITYLWQQDIPAKGLSGITEYVYGPSFCGDTQIHGSAGGCNMLIA